MTIRVYVIGIGSGNPHQLTGEAIAAMNAVDVFLVADKAGEKHDLAALRRELCRSVVAHGRYRWVEVPDPVRDLRVADYGRRVADWHAARAERYAAAIAAEVGTDGTVGFLVWGDPAFYDSTIRIVDDIAETGLTVDLQVIPGISSVQLLAARHRIVLNRIGQPVHLTTGRRLVEEYDPALGDVVVMLDGDLACAELVGRHPDLQIFWGAQLGLPDERLVSGRLADVVDELRRTRSAARVERGWVMDIYLLRPGLD